MIEVDSDLLIKAITEQRDGALSMLAGFQAKIWMLEAEIKRLQEEKKGE